MKEEETTIKRREFLAFLGALPLVGCASNKSKKAMLPASSPVPTPAPVPLGGLGFAPIDPSGEDRFVLAPGLEQSMLIKWDDPINGRGERFGYNNDFIATIPISKNQAFMMVNHEYVHPLFVSDYVEGETRTKEQVDKERASVGVSVLKIRKDRASGKWEVDLKDPHNRRISGATEIPFAPGFTVKERTAARGTLGNCAGGVTPWGTFLTCEENYDMFYGEQLRGQPERTPSLYGWEKFYPRFPEHYGWVVEIDPRSGRAKKLVALGRFAHEGAKVVKGSDGRVVVYMGDDKADEFVYKFISHKKAGPGALDSGDLYVAKRQGHGSEEGQWLHLSWEKQPLLKQTFKDQTEVLVYAREAARLLGATPMDRPEDIEINPRNGDVLIACTNNYAKLNFHGSIVCFREKGGDHLAMEFEARDFLVGGEESGISCPDNMAFDRKGNLWVTTDMAGNRMNKAPYGPFKNNGLFYMPLYGKFAGTVFQVASAPGDAEITGPWFSEDNETLFVSVQHPGEESRSRDPKTFTSHWPQGGQSVPAPAVLQIHGQALRQLLA